jgi:hypothetical protein
MTHLLEQLRTMAWDPAAPVPAGWPHGWWGTLLLFLIPGGIGIPSGVLLGHGDGFGPPALTLLYVASDVVLALVFEPMILVLVLVGRHRPGVRRVGRGFVAAMHRLFPTHGASVSMAVMGTGFVLGLPFGRLLGAGAGYGLVPSWALAIAGDTCSFAVGMLSTLWFNGVLGDQRLAVAGALVVMLAVSAVVRRWHGSPQPRS